MGLLTPNPFTAVEITMRTTVSPSQMHQVSGLPRGWVVLGLTLASWALVAGMWAGMSQLYGFVASAI